MDKWLKNNLVAKIIALLIAIMLWMVVNLDDLMKSRGPVDSTQPTTIIDKQLQGVEVIPHYESDQFIVVNMDQTVNVTLKGERRIVSNPIDPNSYEVFVDLRGLNAGTHMVPVSYKGFPAGVRIEINPAKISVTLEEKQLREMSVLPEIIGAPAAGYSAEEPIVQPVKVFVKGSSNQLNNIAFVKASININGATDTITKKVNLKVVDINGDVMDAEVEPAVVDMTIPISRPSVTVPFSYHVEGRPAKGFAIAKISAEPSEITLFGPKESLPAIESFPIQINVEGLNKTETFDIHIPKEGISAISPEKVTVTVEIIAAETVKLQALPIRFEGISENYEVEIINPSIENFEITVEGAPQEIANIEREEIVAYINVEQFGVGIYDEKVHIILPWQFRLVGEVPTITFEIKEIDRPAHTLPDGDRETAEETEQDSTDD